MAGTDQQRRRFLTRHDVEDAAREGRPLQLHGRDTLTDEAAQRAMDLGVAVERDSTRPVAAGPARRQPAPTSGELRRAVRAAVVAELGSEPPGLDAALDRVLARRSG